MGHGKYHKGKIDLKIKKSNGFKAETFMSMVRWRLINQLKNMDENVSHTYGYLTKNKRVKQKLSKFHINDAYVIANGNGQLRLTTHCIQKTS